MIHFLLAPLLLLDPGFPGDVPSRPPPKTTAAPAPKPDEEACRILETALRAQVRYLSDDCIPRDWEHPANLEKAASYIESAFRSHGARVRSQVIQVHEKRYRNVLARFGPEKGELIVLGAHYDAFGPHPGADDNASGVAGLLELARLLKQQPPRFPVELAAYVLEEPPFFRSSFMGSAVHARSLKAAGVKLRFMLSVDMIGSHWDETTDGKRQLREDALSLVGLAKDATRIQNMARSLEKASGLRIRTRIAPRETPGLDWSDHLPFWNLGDAAALLTDSEDRLSPRYHTAGDTLEHLDFSRMAQTVQGLRHMIEALETVPEKRPKKAGKTL